MGRDTETARENYERFAYGRDHGHLDYVEKAEKCDRYMQYDGHWDKSHAQRLLSIGKPVITINKVLATFAAAAGEQIANRADIAFRKGTGGQHETAVALDKLWMHIAAQNNLDWLESEVAAEAFIRSRGFYDLRADFDDNLMGEARITKLNSKSVIIDPDSESYDPDDWHEVTVSKWLALMDVRRTYGERFAKELGARGESSFSFGYDTLDWEPDSFGGTRYSTGKGYEGDPERRRMYRAIERQYREMKYVDCMVDPRNGDMREIPDTWSRERIQLVMDTYGWVHYRKRVSKIRWTTSIDDVLVHDAVSPYKHFTPVPYFPFFFHGKTVGLVENQISPADLLNKTISQELHIVNTTANSGWKVEEGALANMTVAELEERSGEDGLVIVTHGDTKKVDKIQPNQVPTGIDRLSQKADQFQQEVSMIPESMQGMDRADVAAKAIEMKSHRGAMSLTKPFENLNNTRRILGRNTLDLVQTFYTEHRVLHVTTGGIGQQSEEVEINAPTPEGTIANDLTVGEYSVVVNAVPARQDYEQAQFQQAKEMRADMGINIPDHIIIESSNLARKGEIADEVKQLNGGGEPSEQAQAMEAAALALEEAKVETEKSQANLNNAKAQEAQLPQREQQNNAETEMLGKAIDREKMISEGNLNTQKASQEMALKEQAHEDEMALKEKTHQDEMELKRAEFALKKNAQEEEMALKKEAQQDAAAAAMKAASTKPAAPAAKPAAKKPAPKK